jgi:hypothetical protein
MPDDPTLIPLLVEAIQRLYGCEAVHEATVPVHEESHGQAIGKRDAGVFRLKGHPASSRCTAWLQRECKTVRYVTVLLAGPKTSPEPATHALTVFNYSVNR